MRVPGYLRQQLGALQELGQEHDLAKTEVRITQSRFLLLSMSRSVVACSISTASGAFAMRCRHAQVSERRPLLPR